MFQITITSNTDLLGIRTAHTASEMEDIVTALHIEFPGALVTVEHIDAHKGWTIDREAEYGGLMVIRRPDGTKYGTTQSEAGARIMRRRAIERNA